MATGGQRPSRERYRSEWSKFSNQSRIQIRNDVQNIGTKFALSKGMAKIKEATRDHIADENFAFPEERKEPIHDAAHVRNAIARFTQVKGVTEAERDAAWKRIKTAANKHNVTLHEKDWRELS
jgi:hypothetical protein